jgi:hypothetical protein
MQENLIVLPASVAAPLRLMERGLDRLVHPYIIIGSRRWRAFHLFLLTGIASGIAVMVLLLGLRDVALRPLLPIVMLAISAFLVSAVMESFFLRREQLTYYHHAVAAFAPVLITLRWTHRPPLPYIDALALGIGTALAFCRAGCLMAGCCHGRPHSWGVRYLHAHVACGFPRALADVRLMPVQAFESFAVTLVVIAGALRFVGGAPFGETTTHYFVSYAIVRICLERLRGDAKRKYLGGISEAQWTSCTVLLLIAAAEAIRLLPATRWHYAAAVVVPILVMIFGRTSLLARPGHLFEMATIIDHVSGANRSAARSVEVFSTTAGLRVSGSFNSGMAHYAVSRLGMPLQDPEIRAIARLAQRLRHASQNAEIVPGNDGVIHVLFRRPLGAPAVLPGQVITFPPTFSPQRRFSVGGRS